VVAVSLKEEVTEAAAAAPQQAAST